MLYHLLSEERSVEVGIDLRCVDTFVAEHGLNGAQIGASFEQMGGKGVAQRVGRDGLVDSCIGGEHLQHVEHCDAREVLPAPVADKHVVLFPSLRLYVASVREPQP